MARQERDVGGVMVGINHKGGARYGSVQRDGRSELLKAQAEDGPGTNFCPFGCNDDELDEQGYCFHLIGFSPDGRKLERNEVGEDGRVRTKAPIRRVNGRITLVHNERVDPARHVKVPIVVGGSFRIYENIPRPDDYPEYVSDELSDEEIAAMDAEEAEEEAAAQERERAAADAAETYGQEPEKTPRRSKRRRANAEE
jgi:hypothetical protein